VRILASVVLSLSLAACSGGAASPATSTGAQISETRAEAAARAAMPGTASLTSAKVGPIGGFGGTAPIPGNPVVWALTFTGSFPLGCGPAPLPSSSPKPCPPPATSATVFIDARTGDFVQAIDPAISP
jgi:hypothetical protein